MPGATRASTIPLDIASNIVGYLPLGIILGGLGPLGAIIIAGLISSGVEAAQLVMMHRDAPFTDALSNVVCAARPRSVREGAGRSASRALGLSRRNGLIAGVLAVAAVVYVRPADTWYHVAGVFDAPAKTLSVYLNGERDNGFSLGSVTSAQRTSRGVIYVGSTPEFNFTGIARARTDLFDSR